MTGQRLWGTIHSTSQGHPRPLRHTTTSGLLRATTITFKLESTTMPAPRSRFAPMARPKVHQEPRVTTALRVPRDLHERLKLAAEERQVAVNLLAVKALEDYLDRLIPVEDLRLTR